MRTNIRAQNALRTHEGAMATRSNAEQALRRSVLSPALWFKIAPVLLLRAPPGLLVSRGMRAGTKPRPRTDHRLLRGISSETLHRGGTAQYDYSGSKLGWPLFRSKLSWCPSSPTFECVGERADLAISQ